jgi:ADP-ribose pyrophosphatase YjhB (NUDIX family)
LINKFIFLKYPPKGHLDAGEDVLKRAVRETHSITALRQDDDYEIRDENFKLEVNYSGDSKPKHVTYWLALLKKPYGPITLSLDEHQDFKWVTLEKAVETVKDNELAEAYNKVNAYLLENPKE